MTVTYTDFYEFGKSRTEKAWLQMRAALLALPLYVKQSDQKGKVGSLIFDPVGTNEAIKLALQERGWTTRIPIPAQHSALGTDVDYGIHGVLGEGQFSNYPFLLNNVMRTNVFHQKQVLFSHVGRVAASIIVTKVRALPASNSTLYYEQACKQMEFMREAGVLTVPTRLVGLGAEIGRPLEAVFSVYAARQSRTVRTRESVRCLLKDGPREDSRCQIIKV